MRRTKSIDTRFTHSGTNLFRELGFLPSESKRLQCEPLRMLRESKRERAAGRFVKGTVEEYIRRVRKLAR
jgi:hypothetical protein